MNIKLTKEENEIESNIDKYVKVSKREKEEIEKVIDNAVNKRSITLRINDNDLEKIKFEAEKDGLPYQTLISSVLHKYITHQLVEEKSIKKAIAILK
ncbi:MAG: CopG family antitoxin [Candidatus Anammoxibacter sp.]